MMDFDFESIFIMEHIYTYIYIYAFLSVQSQLKSFLLVKSMDYRIRHGAELLNFCFGQYPTPVSMIDLLVRRYHLRRPNHHATWA